MRFLITAAIVAITALPLFAQSGRVEVRDVVGRGPTRVLVGENGAPDVFLDGPAAQPQPPVSAAASPATATDALDRVNAQRAARGLPAYIRDESLTVAATRAAEFRASKLMFGHTANDFQFLPAGAHADAAGCAAYPSSYGFTACAVYDREYRYAGAATVIGADGKAYNHLFVRR